MVLTVSFGLSPVIGLSCHRRLAFTAKLDASVEASGPHDFAVRLGAVRQRHLRVHRIPPRVRDDRDTPLWWDETVRTTVVICVERKPKYFSKWGWTGKSVGSASIDRAFGRTIETGGEAAFGIRFEPAYRCAHAGYSDNDQLTGTRLGSTISNIRGNSSISAINSARRIALPVNVILPPATASGKLVCFAITSSSTLRGKVKLASAAG